MFPYSISFFLRKIFLKTAFTNFSFFKNLLSSTASFTTEKVGLLEKNNNVRLILKIIIIFLGVLL